MASGGPPTGRLKLGKVPLSFSLVIELYFPLTLFKGFLFTDIFPYGLLIQPHRAYTVSPAPEMQPCHLLLTQDLPVDSHRTLALDKPDRKRHTLLGRNAYAHVDVVRHHVPFDQLDSPLPAYPLITSPTCFFSFPYSILFRCFGMMTIWYLHSHRTWDRLWHSSIGSSPLSFHGTFPGGRAYFILPRIGRTYPGPPPEVEGLVTNKPCT